MALYLKDALFIDWKTLNFKKGDIKINEGIDGKIEFIKKIPDNEKYLDCNGKLVTKSFGCAHHHVYSALARGMPASKNKIKNFPDILKFVWWSLDKNLDKDMIKASALVTAIACAKNGVTFIIDHHSSPFAVKDSLNIISEAFDEIGVSGLLCIELSDRDGRKIAYDMLEETDDFLSSGGRGLVGLHASFTVGNELLKNAIAISEKHNSGIHVHIAEDLVDQQKTYRKYGKSVIERFSEAGVLSFNKTILAHCLHLDDKEREIISKSGCWVVENIESNLNNKVGYFNSRGLGKNIMLGTDGMHSDMLRSAKSAYFVGQKTENASMPEIYGRFRNIHKYIEQNQFKGDGENNLVILNYDTPTEINKNNFTGHFFFGIENRHIESVISNGKLILNEGKIQNIDEDEVNKFAKKMAAKLWKKMNNQ
jgi:cytosine/adenosine deaminase-related metal-dependent hydrolase